MAKESKVTATVPKKDSKVTTTVPKKRKAKTESEQALIKGLAFMGIALLFSVIAFVMSRPEAEEATSKSVVIPVDLGPLVPPPITPKPRYVQPANPTVDELKEMARADLEITKESGIEFKDVRDMAYAGTGTYGVLLKKDTESYRLDYLKGKGINFFENRGNSYRVKIPNKEAFEALNDTVVIAVCVLSLDNAVAASKKDK